MSRGWALSRSPTGEVNYHSRGVVLVTGPAGRALPAARELAGSLKVVAFCSGSLPPAGDSRALTVVAGQIVEISGYLGQFTARSLGKNGEPLDAGPFSPNLDRFFDLVLDLNLQPLLGRSMPPPGYHAPADAAALDAALAALRTSVGKFSKPRYVSFDPGLCAHGTRGIEGCTRCLDACPAGALTADGDRVSVEPQLCQGCAACALVCPTGALSFSAAAPRALLNAALEAAEGAGSSGLVVAETGRLSRGPAGEAIWIETPVLAAVGMEWWLAALASGVSAVALQVPADLPLESAEGLKREMALARRILDGIGAGPDRLVSLPEGDPAALEAVLAADRAPVCRATPAIDGWDKREVFFAALDSLIRALDTENRVLDLPEDAPFGRVRVSEACTVCLACANLCPTGALAPADSGMALGFIEQRCVQCGICVAGCPERAISLEARLDCDPDRRGATAVLRTTEAVVCIECGTPFMSRALLEASMAKLRLNPAFTGVGLEILRLCPECRQERFFGS